MNRKFLDTIAILTLLMYIELNHLNMFIELDILTAFIAKFSILTLIVPFMAIMVRVLDRASLSSVKNALVITVSNNHLAGYRNSDKLTFKTQCFFSDDTHFIATEANLEKGINTVIRELMKDKGKFTVSPYVVIKTDIKSISDLEKESLAKNTYKAGAIKVSIVDLRSNDSDIQESISSNPIENFA